jgi:hypothetical protein
MNVMKGLVCCGRGVVKAKTVAGVEYGKAKISAVIHLVALNITGNTIAERTLSGTIH